MPGDKGIIFSDPMIRAIFEGSKTMTRRLVNPQPADDLEAASRLRRGRFQLGDRLWVRESYAEADTPGVYVYRADGHGSVSAHAMEPSWKSPMFMPRRACRILLQVTSVCIEHLHQITDAEAQAEGVASRTAFQNTWTLIHGKGEWDKDPWVFAVGFRRIE